MNNRIYLITFTLLFGIFSLNAAVASVVTDGLVSYWTFDKGYVVNKTLKDVWGDNDGKIVGNPKVVPGRVGEALEFDGSGDFVNLSTLGDFGRQIGTASFEAWIKTSNEKRWMTLINTHGAECPYWGIEFNGVNEKNKFEITERMLYYYFSVGGPRSCGSVGSGTRMNIIFDGEWHHIVYTSDYVIDEGVGGSGKTVMYIDGVSGHPSNHSFSGNRAFSPFTAPVTLGARKFPGRKSTGHFMGMIDEVRLYARPLTTAEVYQNFVSTQPYNVASKRKLSTVWGKIKSLRIY